MQRPLPVRINNKVKYLTLILILEEMKIRRENERKLEKCKILPVIKRKKDPNKSCSNAWRQPLHMARHHHTHAGTASAGKAS